MTEEEFAVLFRFLVEFCPPDPAAARLIWRKIAALLEEENEKENRST